MGARVGSGAGYRVTYGVGGAYYSTHETKVYTDGSLALARVIIRVKDVHWSGE